MNGIIWKPTERELGSLLAEATQNGSTPEAAWCEDVLQSFSEILHKNPLQYRCFGPYWWLLKSMLLKNGELDFGASIDREWKEKLDYGSTTVNLLAIYTYYDYAIGHGLMLSQKHVVSYEDEESEVYTLVDKEMEMLTITWGS